MSNRDRSRPKTSHDPDQQQSSSRFGWQRTDASNRSPERAQYADSDGQDKRSPGDQGQFWAPPQPGDLPPTIIRRQKPPTGAELISRFGKPAVVGLSIAAVSTGSLWQSAQAASSEPASKSPSGDARNVRVGGEHSAPLATVIESGEVVADVIAAAERDRPVFYTVQEGDEVREIARGFGLQTMTVVWNNNLSNPDLIHPGDELLIPPVDGLIIEVQVDDTLRDLATRYGVNTTAIINYEPNGIADPDLIHPGTVLMIPGGAPPAAPASAEAQQQPTQRADTGQAVWQNEVVVEPGDTLGDLAYRYGVTAEELAQANRIGDVDVIQPGDVLNVPDADVERDQETTAPPPTQPEAVEPEPASEPEPDPEPQPTPEPQPDPTQAPAAPPPPDPTPTPAPPPPPDPTPTPEPAPDPTPEPEPQQDASGPPGDIPGLLEYYSHQYGLDPNLVKAVAWRESGWNQNAVSSSGAQGVMQIMPGTGTWINNNLVSENLNIAGSAADNIHAGTAYLAHRINQFGSVEQGLAAYFLGPARVQNGIPEAGWNYVNRIFEIRDYIATNGQPPNWR